MTEYGRYGKSLQGAAAGKTRTETLAGGRAAGSPTGKGAALSAVNLLASRYAKTTLGLDEFALEDNVDGKVNVTVGKRIDERMGVRASSEFGANATTTFAVEYRLTNNALVVATPNDDGSVSLMLQYRVPIR